MKTVVKITSATVFVIISFFPISSLAQIYQGDFGNTTYSYSRAPNIIYQGVTYTGNTTRYGSSYFTPDSYLTNTSGTAPSYTQTASVANAYPQLPKTGGGGRELAKATYYSTAVYWSGGIILLLILGYLYFRKSKGEEQKIEFEMSA